jgi:hypothetical protein
LNPHILTLSQIVHAKLMQRGEHEINLSREFVENNFDLSVEVLAPKRKANRVSTLDTN